MTPFRRITKQTAISVIQTSKRAGIRWKEVVPINASSSLTIWWTEETVFRLVTKFGRPDKYYLDFCSVSEADGVIPLLP
jgi:hypothetical protein